MQRLLHIDASPRDTRSRSRNVTQAFMEALTAHKPQVNITTMDVWRTALPDLGDGMIEGRYNLIMGEDVPADIKAAWDHVASFVQDFLSYDGYIFSVPMWNFGIPYKLKHYIDVITQPRMIFTNDAVGNVVGHAAGKKAILIAASAMPIGKVEGFEAYDFQQAYLEKWLGFIGITDIACLRVAPTYGAPADVEAVMAAAREEAKALAARL